jgi:raffinose/stachyose/melibiose transport system substrate-binding protein
MIARGSRSKKLMKGDPIVHKKLIVLLIAAAALVAGSALAATSGSAKVKLTLWHNYGTEANAVAAVNLAKAFEKAHPEISVKVVSQPAANYFALLQASAISKTGPDLGVMWTGLFAIKYQKFLLNLKPYFSSAEQSKIKA